MIRWHHWLSGHEFEQILGAGDGQGSLLYCCPGGRKKVDTTEWLNWTELDNKEIKPVHFKGNQPWMYPGRAGVESENPVFWPCDSKSWLMEETLMLGEIDGKRRRGQLRMKWLDSIINSMDMNLSKVREKIVDRRAWSAKVNGVAKYWTLLSDLTATTLCSTFLLDAWKWLHENNMHFQYLHVIKLDYTLYVDIKEAYLNSMKCPFYILIQ